MSSSVNEASASSGHAEISASVPMALPPPHPIFGHLFAFQKDPLGFLSRCARQYERVAPLRMLHIRAFLLLDPSDIERVLVTEHSDFVKPDWLKSQAVKRLLGAGLVSSDGEDWRRQRRACQPAFQLRRMEAYAKTVLNSADRRTAKWRSGQTIDLQKEMTHLTLEIVARTMMNVDENDWTEETGVAMDTLMARFTAGKSFFGMIPFPPDKREREATERLNRIVDFLISRNERENETRKQTSGSNASEEGTCPFGKASAKPGDSQSNLDLLSMLRQEANPGAVPTPDALRVERPGLREQMKTFLGAGYESSSLTLTWALLSIARNPDVEERLASERSEVLRGGELVHSDLPKLNYARAVIQETLRLYPPLWMTGREAARDCEIGGVRIPAGALVMTSQWAVQRLSRYFPDPELFRPERWLSDETSNLPRFAYFPFGGGPRICIAQNFALMETTALMTALLSKFRVSTPDDLDLTPWATMTLRPPTGIRVQLERRD